MKELKLAEDFCAAKLKLESYGISVEIHHDNIGVYRAKEDFIPASSYIKFANVQSFLDFVKGYVYGHYDGVSKKVEELSDPECTI